VHIAPVPEAQRLQEVLAGLPVLLECQVSPPDAPVHWLKDGKAVVPTEVLAICSEGCSQRLHIPAAALSDSGMYTCDAGDDAASFRVTVSEAPVRIVSSNEEAPHAYVAGQRVELWCQLSRPTAPVHWYKDGEEVEVGESLVLEQEGPRHRLVLPCARPQDAGEFVCDAGGGSVFYTVTVAPGCVELRCELSVPDAPVSWFKDGLEVDETDNLLLLAEGAWRCLLIPRSSAEDAGEYICESKDEAVSFDVRVSEPPVRILQPHRPPPIVTVSPGETVTLDCELSRADAPVCWTKEGVRLEAGGSLVLEEEGAHRCLLIPAARAEHSGKYVCDATDDTVTFTVQVSDPLVRILERDVLPTHRHCRAMEDLVLEVHLSHAHGEVKWYKDGEKLQDTGRVRLEEDGAHRSLIVLGTTGRDAGEYLCDTGDDSIIFFVTVEARPVRIVNKEEVQSPLEVLEGDSVTLVARLSPETAAAQWQKDGQTLRSGGRLLVCSEGPARSLTIKQVELGDSGIFLCDAGDDEVHFMLHVKARKVLIRTPLADVETFEKETATFHLELSHPSVPGVWTRDGIRVKPSGTCRISATGCGHSLTLEGLALEDSGTITFTTDTLRCSARLLVREPPVTMVRVPRDLGVLEMGVASFECELSRPSVEVKWLKDGQELRPGPNCRIYSAGRRRILPLSRCALRCPSGL
ncbi:PREDICTED: obscurin-like protein 1, partial [Pygoscelis adeliae]|uniref:obscurin-like protein 1 n=1 Tax=Pygoscelis adeliae TaxID=9238 RepID=UPI0004F4FC27